MNNKPLETMSRLTHCITAINGWSGPALTQYGQEHGERAAQEAEASKVDGRVLDRS